MADVDIPEWAKERAVELANEHRVGFAYRTDNVNPAFAALFALACHVAEYEEPPVDPLLIEARKICTDESRVGVDFTAGELDDWFSVRCVYAALKRGMELAQKEK